MRLAFLTLVALASACGTAPVMQTATGGGDDAAGGGAGVGGGTSAAGGGDAAGGGATGGGDASGGGAGGGHMRWDSSMGATDCATAWGTNGDGLSVCDTVKDNYVVVRKAARNTALCHNGTLVKNFPSGLGFAPVGDKEKEGDGKTPEGVFFVAQLLPNSSYYKAFLVSYPDSADAVRGMATGLITAPNQMAIDMAQSTCTKPPQDTGLGGLIEVHGDGSSTDWTVGCVALDNPNIDSLWAVLAMGDSIVILP